MTDKRDESRGDFSANNADDRVISDRVQELTWALLDEQINDDEFKLLDNLLLADEQARNSYVECVQLHTNLLTYFAPPKSAKGAKGTSDSPVLGFLSGDAPFGLQSPSGEKALQ